MNSLALHNKLKHYIGEIVLLMDRIPLERKSALQRLAGYIRDKASTAKQVNLIFICTHNSRRSQMSQVWAATAAAYYGLKDVYSFSGGTEVTAFNPRAVAALQRAGFETDGQGGDNTHYFVSYAEDATPLECFSKTYDDLSNPQRDFVAVMTCSHADQNCPYIPGASLRSPIRYEDPKAADDTPQEAEIYDERCRQIAAEMFFLMFNVK